MERFNVLGPKQTRKGTMSNECNLTFDRRQALRYALGMMAAVGADPLLLDGWMAQAHQHAEQSAESGKNHRPLAEGSPTFFTANEFKSLTRLADVIIPRTDTPGAADAGVPLYIDIVLGADEALGERFRKGLRELDAAAVKAGRKNFADSSEAVQTKVLRSMLPRKAPGNEFFEIVKAMTLVGYYSSEIGLFEELHFKGNEALSSFPGCPHGGHSVDIPRRRVAGLTEDGPHRWPFPTSDDITREDL